MKGWGWHCIGLNVGLDGSRGSASCARADHGSGTADLLLPVDERLHGAHKGIVADNEQMTGLDHGRIFAQAFAEVDEVVAVHGLNFWIHLHLV